MLSWPGGGGPELVRAEAFIYLQQADLARSYCDLDETPPSPATRYLNVRGSELFLLSVLFLGRREDLKMS